MRPRLIVNADDFGLTPGINRAVQELHQAGVLSSATLMAKGEAFTEAAGIARANPGLGVGCHLVFADGVPVLNAAEIPSLTGPASNTFRNSLLSFGIAVMRGAVHMDELRREAEAQVERLLQAGVTVTHVDTHKHLHCLPPIRNVVTAIARQYGIGVRQVYEPRWSVACSKAGSGPSSAGGVADAFRDLPPGAAGEAHGVSGAGLGWARGRRIKLTL